MSVAWPQKTVKEIGQSLPQTKTLTGNPTEGEQGSETPASGPAKPSGVGFPRAARDEDANPIIAS